MKSPVITWPPVVEGFTPYYADDSCLLFLGDCRDILPRLASDSVECIISDPPYGHNNNNGDLILRRECALGKRKATTQELQDDKTARPIANDGAEANDLYRSVLPEWYRLLKPGCCCCCCCCGGGGPDPQFARWSLWLDEVFSFKQMVVWDKGPIGMGWHYRRSYETILVAEKPGAACHWFDESQQIENIIRPGYKGISKISPSASDHPTPKPVALAAHFLTLHTAPGDVVLDPFAGAGWVMEACRNAGRKFIGVEIEERWCAAAVDRLRQSVFDFDAEAQH